MDESQNHEVVGQRLLSLEPEAARKVIRTEIVDYFEKIVEDPRVRLSFDLGRPMDRNGVADLASYAVLDLIGRKVDGHA